MSYSPPLSARIAKALDFQGLFCFSSGASSSLVARFRQLGIVLELFRDGTVHLFHLEPVVATADPFFVNIEGHAQAVPQLCGQKRRLRGIIHNKLPRSNRDIFRAAHCGKALLALVNPV